MFDTLGGTLIRLGISPDRSGYIFLIDIITLLKDTPLLVNLTDKVYRQVATKYRVSVKSVDRAVRVAIRDGWQYRDKEFADKLFGGFLQSENDLPTNKKFIGFVKWYMDEQEKQHG